MPISILVTGGVGFVGSLIIQAIQERHPEWQITIFDTQVVSQPDPHVRYFQGDVTNENDVEKALSKFRPRAVIHTAGLVPSPLHERFRRTLEAKVMSINVDGTRHMLDGSRRHGVTAFVWTGSCCAVTDDFRYQYRNINETYPTSTTSLIYGKSKAIAEQMVVAANSSTLSTCALRPSVLFGPGKNQLIDGVHACIAKWETPFIIGNAENLWDVSYAPNIADAHVLAVENLLSTKTAAGEAIFIQNNEPITFRHFCLEVWKNFGHIPRFEIRVPMSLAWLTGLLAEGTTWITGGAHTLSRGSVLDACATRYASGDKAAQLLGYKPRVGIEEGIRLSCDYYKQVLGID